MCLRIRSPLIHDFLVMHVQPARGIEIRDTDPDARELGSVHMYTLTAPTPELFQFIEGKKGARVE